MENRRRRCDSRYVSRDETGIGGVKEDMTRREFVGALALRADTKAWVRMKDLPERRIFEIATTIRDRIFVVTSGEDGKRGTEVHVYDPKSDAWTIRAWANTVRHSFGAGMWDGRIYIWGGVANGALTDSAEVYDPKADRWSAVAPLPRPRVFAKGVGVAGRLYAVGGIVPPGRRQFRWLDVYSPWLDRWTAGPDLPLVRDAYRAVGAAGRVYVVGQLGHGAESLAFEPHRGEWSIAAPMPTQRYDFAVTAMNRLVYTFGGNGSDAVEVYDTVSDKWETRGPMPHVNWCQTAAAVDPYVYVIGGGFPARNVLRCMWRYEPRAEVIGVASTAN